jgi:hypothetical protein
MIGICCVRALFVHAVLAPRRKIDFGSGFGSLFVIFVPAVSASSFGGGGVHATGFLYDDDDDDDDDD